jgi:N-acetylmuramoyl-L-alanine amidase
MIPNSVVVHHSLTKDSGTVSWNAIRRYHMTPEEQGGPAGGPWKDIGYHLGVELVTTADLSTYEALLGRPWDEAGAHCPGMNSHSLGVCFIGNFDEVVPPEEQLIVGAKWIAYWLRRYGISLASIFPHHQFHPKSCPGTKFSMEHLKELVRSL